jgi:thiol-disulfide isomerase/thioredoxin
VIPLALLFLASLVNDVHELVARHDLASAERLVRSYQAQAGNTPEVAAAVSWMARGAVEEKQYDRAETYAGQARQLTDELLRTRRLDADPWLPMALGASIEVHSEVLAARGERPEAIAFLRKELAAFGSTSIGERIRKDLNLLNLTGKPAPALEEREWLGPQPVTLAAWKGHPVLLFFWAHWCPDCKAEAPVIASMMEKYGPKGLKVVAPTRLYGYIGGGMDAPPAVEKQYIDHVRRQYYPMLSNVPIPISSANFLEYGASSTPTLVLLDAAGIVRYYHPGAATEAELDAEVRKVVGK